MTPTDTGPSRGLVRYDGPRNTSDLRDYALLLAVNQLPDGSTRRNDALPETFRGNPAAVAFVTEYAKAIDVSPITALMGIHFIEGKPAASAGLISALVRRAGHQIRTWTEGSIEDGTFMAITTIRRADDLEFEYRSEWTLARAMRAELCSYVRDPQTGKWTVTARTKSGRAGGWEKYTEALAKARTITEASRDAAEDALLGVHYTPEELGAEIDENGEVVHTVTTLQSSPDVQERVEEVRADMDAARGQGVHAAQTAAGEKRRAGGGVSPVDPDNVPDIPIRLVEEVRDQILAATTRDDLVAAWGKIGREDVFRAVKVGDEHDVEIVLYDLFGRAVEACQAGTAPLRKPQEPDQGDGGTEGHPTDDGPRERRIHDHYEDEPCDDRCPAFDPQQERVAARDAAALTLGEAVEIIRTRPSIDRSKVDVDRIMAQIPPSAVASLVEWAKAQGTNPGISSGNCALIAQAVGTGKAFTDQARADLKAFNIDPAALVIAVAEQNDDQK